jgi:hypothetical protein
VDTLFGVVEHLAKLDASVGIVLGGGLGLDEAAVGEHDDVHVDGGTGVFFIGQVEQDVAIDDADGCGGDHLLERGCFEGAGFDQLAESEGEGYAGSCDGSGASAAVGLEDVAVEDDGALAESLHVDDAAEAAADEALDLMGAAADFAALALAGGAGEGGAREHTVFGGDPAATGVAEPAGDALLDGGVAEDTGVAGLHENGTFGHGDVVRSDADGAEGLGGAVVGAEELGGGGYGGYRHDGIIVGRFFARWDGVECEPFVGVFRNGTGSIMGGLSWSGVCWGFGWGMLFVVPIWEVAAVSEGGGWEAFSFDV